MLSNDNVIEVNSETYADYTYHRHSAPKDVVYYRCSDKKCKARLHYNQKTKEITLKNQHLDPEVHKKPKLSRVIAIDSLPQYEGARKRGRCTPAPVMTKEPVPVKEEPLICLERLPESQPERIITLLNCPPTSSQTLRVYLSCPQTADLLCQEAISSNAAIRAVWVPTLTSYSYTKGGFDSRQEDGYVELEVSENSVKAAQRVIRSIAPEASLEVFSKCTVS